jgi:hypothetical protein
MKRVGFYFTISFWAFTFGLAVVSWWNAKRVVPRDPPTKLQARPIPTPAPAPPPPIGLVSTATPLREARFANGRLRVVPREVHLKSERFRYKIDVIYPQIVGSKDHRIRELNRHIKALVTNEYPDAEPSKADRRQREKHPEIVNELDLDYEIILATDSLLSIQLSAFSYSIGAAHGGQFSLAVNYDLRRHKQLKLADVFKPKSKYLEFLASYCTDAWKKLPDAQYLFEDRLTPTAEVFKSWNLTDNGIEFTFDSCEVAACVAGTKQIEIPFTTLKPRLRSQFLKNLPPG